MWVGTTYMLCDPFHHYSDVILGTIASVITSLTIVYSTVYSGADQRKHQSSASLVLVRGFLRWPVNSPHKRVSNAENVSIRWRHHADNHHLKVEKKLICSHYNSDTAIVAKFCTWHHSFVVVVCANSCHDLMTSNWITAKRILNIIGIVSANRQSNGPKFGNVCHRGV